MAPFTATQLSAVPGRAWPITQIDRADRQNRFDDGLRFT
jgi:hypothetical protein